MAKEGKLLESIEEKSYPLEQENTMFVKALSADDFRIKAPVENGTVQVNCMVYKDLLLSSTLLETVEPLLNILLITFLSFYYINWRPLKTFSKDSFQNLFSFGSKLLFSRLLSKREKPIVGRYCVFQFFSQTACI